MAEPKSLQDEVLEATREIVAAEEQLRRAHARLKGLLHGVRRPPLIPPAVAGAGSIGGRVLALLATEPDRGFVASEIADGIGLRHEQLPTLRTTLNRLLDRGEIASPYRGVFKANSEAEPGEVPK